MTTTQTRPLARPASPAEHSRVGRTVVGVFHVLLMVFGWWAWVWCVPALALLTWLARNDVRPAARTRP